MNDKNKENNTDSNVGRSGSDNRYENDSSLSALVSEEQELVRQRLEKKLGREPTQQEMDKWLSEQTEGY